MIPITLNSRDPRPIYLQVKESLRQLIIGGVLTPESKLPSVREIAGTLAINPNTIQRAYRELEAEGFIYSIPGKGSFVSPSREISGEELRRRWEDLDRAVRELRFLGVSEEELIRHLKDKGFDGFAALNQFNMHVPDGSVYGLIGPNGAGKSTIIRHLTGIYRPDSGEVTIDGSPVYENNDIKKRIGYIADEVFFFPQATTADMARFYRGIYPRFDSARFEKLKAAFEISADQPIRKLSRGQQKQSAFWTVLAMHPEILILDEPVDGLDPVMRRQIWSLLLDQVAAEGTTILVSSHNLRELEDVCDHVGIIQKGSMMLERDLTELQDQIVKIQVVLPEEADVPVDLPLVHESSSGNLKELIFRCDRETALDRFKMLSPAYLEAVPLSLEEIFIHELGGAGYGVENILL